MEFKDVLIRGIKNCKRHPDCDGCPFYGKNHTLCSLFSCIDISGVDEVVELAEKNLNIVTNRDKFIEVFGQNKEWEWIGNIKAASKLTVNNEWLDAEYEE